MKPRSLEVVSIGKPNGHVILRVQRSHQFESPINPRSKPKGSFVFKIVKKRGVFTLMIGMRGNLGYTPMSQSAYASRMPPE